MGTVDHHPQARQRGLSRNRPGAQRGDQVIEVLLLLGLGVDDPAEPVPGRRARLPEQRLDLVLDRVRQLAATASEELDPVVLGRVVAGRQDHAKVGVQGLDQKGHTRGGQHAQAEHVHPGAGQPGDHGGLQELTRGAGVAADHRDRALVGRGRPQDLSGRHRQVKGEPGGQLASCYSSDTICTEQAAHDITLPVHVSRIRL